MTLTWVFRSMFMFEGFHPSLLHRGLSLSVRSNAPRATSGLVKFWKPPTEQDVKWHNPYRCQGPAKYVTFEPDVGGWNNIRMQMEIVMVFESTFHFLIFVVQILFLLWFFCSSFYTSPLHPPTSPSFFPFQNPTFFFSFPTPLSFSPF